ncbi:MAG TPA: asparaginase domain-containing protein [Candidatus Nanoarchaeia archaeon]|nr:asparaginase domain-containing protein [Candidatus Nanoarchaeia archaeon]
MADISVHFIITGGTIDSFYDSTKDTVMPNKKSVVPDFIQSLRLYGKSKFTVLFIKDSRDIVKKDLRKILNAVEKSPHKKIIITHGTYTMSDTARYLEANMKRKGKTVIITGSMIPLSGFSPSDGPFELGYSIAKVQNLKEGIYVCMNGRVFSSKEVMKVNSEGRFSSIFGEGKKGNGKDN